jgi:hypothetical protein
MDRRKALPGAGSRYQSAIATFEHLERSQAFC